MRIGDILVAGIAVAVRRVYYDTGMRQFFISLLAVAAVAYYTADLAMCAQQEIGVLDEDLFPYLQRR